MFLKTETATFGLFRLPHSCHPGEAHLFHQCAWARGRTMLLWIGFSLLTIVVIVVFVFLLLLGVGWR